MCQRRSTKCSLGITNWRINSKRFENESNLRASFDVWMKAKEPVFLPNFFQNTSKHLLLDFEVLSHAYTLVSGCCPLVTSMRFKVSWERCELGNLFWVKATLNVNDECALSWTGLRDVIQLTQIKVLSYHLSASNVRQFGCSLDWCLESSWIVSKPSHRRHSWTTSQVALTSRICLSSFDLISLLMASKLLPKEPIYGPKEIIADSRFAAINPAIFHFNCEQINLCH